MEMSRNQHFRHVASPTKVSPSHAAAIRASDEFDKEGLVSWHLSRHHDALVLEKGIHPQQDVLPALPPSPTQLVKQLKPVLLKDMKLGKVHKGRVLRGTFCTKTVKLGSVVNVLEDETGMATMIVMQNMVNAKCSMALAQKLFPTGLQVAVRDPYLHEHDDGMIGILVERPADLVILRVPDANDEPAERRAAPPVTSLEQTAADPRKQQLKQDNAAKPTSTQETPSKGPASNGTLSSHETELSITQETPGSSPASSETEDGSSQSQEPVAALEGAGINPNHSARGRLETSSDTLSRKEEEKPDSPTIGLQETGAFELEEIQQREELHEDSELDEEPGEANRSPSSSQLDAAALRRLGNGEFAQGHWTRAVQLYSSAISEAQSKEANSEELLPGYSNRAEAYLRLQQFDKARSDAEAALAIHGKHAKSLYRMGRALLGTGEHEQALHYLEAAAELAPQDKDLKHSLLECKRMLALARMHKKKRYSRK